MSEVVNQSLRKIAKGAFITFIGTAIGMLLALVARLLVARYVTQDEYGAFSLALVILNFIALISLLGMDSSATRQIAFYRGKGDEPKLKGVVVSSLLLSFVFSAILSIVLFLFADSLSIGVFHNSELSTPLKIICVAIPFFVLISILASIFRGFDRAEPNIYFQNILRNALFPFFCILVFLLNLYFVGVMWAFAASIILTFVAFIIYMVKKPFSSLKGYRAISLVPATKELLLFSLPLFGLSALGSVIIWTDTLMLGFLRTVEDVGLYNAAAPMVAILIMVLSAINFLCVPLMTHLFAKNQIEEIKRSYAVLSKWTFAATLPIFLIFVLFPETTLGILFGSKYMGAALALQILSAGYFVSVVMGPNGATMIAIGETRFIMWSTMVAAIANVILNLVLIPPLGIVGAAIATAVARFASNLFISIRLYSISRMQPFTKNYLKPIMVSGVTIFIIYMLIKNVLHMPFWLLPLFFILFLFIYGLSVLLTKSFDKEDVMMLIAIEQKLGLNLANVKKLLKRFT